MGQWRRVMLRQYVHGSALFPFALAHFFQSNMYCQHCLKERIQNQRIKTVATRWKLETGWILLLSVVDSRESRVIHRLEGLIVKLFHGKLVFYNDNKM